MIGKCFLGIDFRIQFIKGIGTFSQPLCIPAESKVRINIFHDIIRKIFQIKCCKMLSLVLHSHIPESKVQIIQLIES